MKRYRLILLLTTLWLAACSKEPLYQEQAYVFGTLVEVSVYGAPEPQAKQALATVMQEFQRLHSMLHAWDASELNNLNQAFSTGKFMAVSPELALLLKGAGSLAEQSDGLFNPAIGGLVKLWGFHADEFKPAIPDENLLKKLLNSRPRMSDIIFQDKQGLHYAGSHNSAVQVDLGGYAKGYALDRAAVLLKQQGIAHALVNIGGNVLAMGQHGSRHWRVGIQHPRKAGPFATIELHDGEALGTSGDYQRYFQNDGQRYCHIIDPRNGRPVQNVQAVTVLTRGLRAGVLSDAVSKPLFVAGPDAWRAVAKKMQLDDALLINAVGTLFLTESMQNRLTFTDKDMNRKMVP